jgi:hypothetical protein
MFPPDGAPNIDESTVERIVVEPRCQLSQEQ